MDCEVADHGKTPLLQKSYLQSRLKYAKENLRKDYNYCKCVLWPYETKLELCIRDTAHVWRKKREVNN